ncbi:MAG: YegS/Rv2252/BmrU family lipid kinase [Planctomycetia bacterium]|nr:YegS/Rv2252/BmrU family lipid kinase [Planctomycetia bacterium]
MPKKKRYLLIVNPIAGNGKTMKVLPQIENILRAKKIEYEFHFTQEPRHATDLVKEIGNKFDIIVAVGGDGTINEVIDGVPDLKIPFGMIPIGTGNDFARSCSIPYNSIEEAIQILLNHDIKNIDVGEVNGRKFVNVLGMGFEGQVNLNGRKIEFIKGAFRYILAIVYTLIAYKRIPMKLTLDRKILDDDIYMVSIGNGWNVGGGLQLTPKAKLDDGVFDVCYVKEITRWRIVTNFAKLSNGTITDLDEVEMFQAKRIKVESAEFIPIHFDGEMFEEKCKKLNIKIHPKTQPIIGNWSGDKRFES